MPERLRDFVVGIPQIIVLPGRAKPCTFDGEIAGLKEQRVDVNGCHISAVQQFGISAQLFYFIGWDLLLAQQFYEKRGRGRRKPVIGKDLLLQKDQG